MAAEKLQKNEVERDVMDLAFDAMLALGLLFAAIFIVWVLRTM